MYIFGGRSEEGTDLGDLAAFRITSRRWYTFQNMGPSPSPRSGHSMTAFGKQIVVLAGEPSSRERDPSELSLVYILDTAKIRYPNDHQIQQTPAGERVPGNRRPSQERGLGQQMGPPGQRAVNGPNGAPDNLNRKFSGSRESVVGPPRGPGPSMGPGTNIGPGPPVRGQDMANGPSPPGSGSRLPRASMGQAPSGPPPQQQPPPPRTNGTTPPASGPRSRTPTRDGRSGYSPSVDTSRNQSFDANEPSVASSIVAPGLRQVPGPSGSNSRAMSPAVNGRRTPTQQASQQGQRPPQGYSGEEEDQSRYDPLPGRSRSRQGTQGHSPMEEANHFALPNQQQHRQATNQHEQANDVATRSVNPRNDPAVPLQHLQQLQSQHQGLQSQHEGLQTEHQGLQNLLEDLQNKQQTLQQELEAAESRNAWYASELALAKKSGYLPNSSKSTALDENVVQNLGDNEKPLVEALVAMRAHLAEVQGSVTKRENLAAQQLAEIEHQRDNAIREAVYAKTKLAAHGGSHAGTPQSEALNRDLDEEDRSSDIARKLAVALATQNELRTTIASMTNDLQNERRTRELAEGTADAVQKRVTEFEGSQNPGELEKLRTELHRIAKTARAEAAVKAEAYAKLEILQVDKEDLARQLAEALEHTKQHSITLTSLREALTSSTDKASILERKLDEERGQQEMAEHKLRQLKQEHEERTAELDERTAELDEITRKLRHAEEMAHAHAAEANSHRQAVIAGLDKLSTRGHSAQNIGTEDERVPILKQQVEAAHALVRKHQTDADDAADKLRKAEERIAGLEAFQEQSSREGLVVRKQLEATVKESQLLQANHTIVQRELESRQHDASALTVKHNALKELLDERGISEGSRSRLDGPDASRVQELQKQLEESLQAHKEMKEIGETREIEIERTYREKLEVLETDYAAAVTYVKGTEKMLKRMKDELTKYKLQNEKLQSELTNAQRSTSARSLEPEAAADWERERQKLRQEIEEMHQNVQDTHSQLETQMAQVHAELEETSQERDRYRHVSEQAQQQLTQAQHARAELEQLKSENSMLENRVIDAEQRVTLLLDQVGTSVGNYRRQSQQMHGSTPIHGAPNGHSRNLSAISTASSANPGPLNFAGGTRGIHSHTKSTDTDTSSSFPAVPEAHDENSRNSLALDSLASELETLRSQWADTHRTYRLSNNFDFERSTPTSATGTGNMSDSLANWRKRLDAEEAEKLSKRPSPITTSGGNGADKSIGRDRDSVILRPSERMPGGISGLSDDSDSSEDETNGRRNVI